MPVSEAEVTTPGMTASFLVAAFVAIAGALVALLTRKARAAR